MHRLFSILKPKVCNRVFAQPLFAFFADIPAAGAFPQRQRHGRKSAGGSAQPAPRVLNGLAEQRRVDRRD